MSRGDGGEKRVERAEVTGEGEEKGGGGREANGWFPSRRSGQRDDG